MATTLDFTKLLDETGWKLLTLLQQNARTSYSKLGEEVGLSTPAVIERIRKMEEAGIIKGYRVELDESKLGFGMTAFIRLESHADHYQQILEMVEKAPEVRQCFYITGRASFILKVVISSVAHLEDFIQTLTPFGNTATSIVMSAPVQNKPLSPPKR